MAADVDLCAGPEPHGEQAVRLPGDQHAAGLEVVDGEAAARRAPLRRARSVHRLRAQVDERIEVERDGRQGRLGRCPRRRIAEVESGARVLRERRILRRCVRVVAAPARARHRREGDDRRGAKEEAPLSQAGVHASSMYRQTAESRTARRASARRLIDGGRYGARRACATSDRARVSDGRGDEDHPERDEARCDEPLRGPAGARQS